jgi:hypothetical protein
VGAMPEAGDPGRSSLTNADEFRSGPWAHHENAAPSGGPRAGAWAFFKTLLKMLLFNFAVEIYCLRGIRPNCVTVLNSLQEKGRACLVLRVAWSFGAHLVADRSSTIT